MKKYLVETFYTCTFKTVHKLDEINDQSLNSLDERNDGNVELIEVKLNNRKTKRIGKTTTKEVSGRLDDIKSENNLNLKDKLKKSEKILSSSTLEAQKNIKPQPHSRFKMPDRRKVIFRKHPSESTKFIFIQANMMMAELVKYL